MTCDYCEPIKEKGKVIGYKQRCGKETMRDDLFKTVPKGGDARISMDEGDMLWIELCVEHRTKRVTYEMVVTNHRQLTEAWT